MRPTPWERPCLCLVLPLGEERGPPGLGAPWRVAEVGDVPPGLPKKGCKRPQRQWVEEALWAASPSPWQGCPDVIVIPCGASEQGAFPAGMAWTVDAGWLPQQPEFTLRLLGLHTIIMKWQGPHGIKVQTYTRVRALPFRCYFARS